MNVTPIENLVQLLHAKRSGKGWKAKCPAHGDRNPSLSINEGRDGRVLLKCHARCSTEDIVASLGLKMKDLFLPSRNGNAPHGLSRVAPRYKKLRPATSSFDWQSCVDDFTEKDQEQLAEWRGYSDRFVEWLHENALVGLYRGYVGAEVRSQRPAVRRKNSTR